MKRPLLASLLSMLTATGTLQAAPAPRKAEPKKAAAGAARPAAPVKTKKVVKGRWVAATPEVMAEQAAERARAGGKDALAALATLHSLADRAPGGLVRRLLTRLGDGKGEVAEQARWLAASLHPQPQQASLAGLVSNLAVLGPFQDASGKIESQDIKEEEAKTWADRAGNFSWGAYEVRWRPVVTPVTARGVPLDLYVAPAKESCSYVASRITLAEAATVEVHLAASGAARLIWDGQSVGQSGELHEQALFDRLGARIEASAGEHLVAAKVCSGSLDDQRRVRLRVQGAGGKELKFQASRDLSPLAGKSFEKVKAKAIEEPLSKALALGKKPSADEALAGAVLRRLGGVDSLQSPKAPGLLEAASQGAIASDRLAMAGWVSPFGAARSGWLGQARERALAEGDEATADFAARRLAASRIDAGFIDWAWAALNSEPTSKATDDEAALLRALARAEGSDAEGPRRAALAELMARVDKGKPSAAVWGEIARMARSLDPKIELQARDELARLSPERFDLERLRAAAALDASAVVGAAVASIEQGGLSDAGELAAAAAMVQGAGRDADARKFLKLASQLAPNVSAVQQALAQALFDDRHPEDREAAERALKRARELQPGDARLRAELAFRSKDAQRQPQRDERWLVDASALLARAKASPAKAGDVADRQVYWMRAVTQHDDRRVSQLIQYGREIVIAPRQQEELYENIPAEGEETEILRARVHRENGEVVFAEEAKSDQGRPLIRWPDLKTGDVVEVVVRSWTSNPIGRRGDPPFYFLDYGGAVATHPLLFNHVVLDLPKERPLAVDILNGKADRVESKEEGGRVITQYIWDKPVTLPDEPLAPRPSEVFPTLAVSSFGSWDEFREWYRGAVAGFTTPDEQVRKLATELTAGKTTREEKINALFNFVADDIRYVNYISGEWWLPNRPQQLLARRQGDCDDKAILLITLLKTIGVEATEVLIQTRLTAQPSLLLSKKAAIPLFDHGIAYLPAKDGHPAQWLDATSPQSRIGPLPSMDARTYALFTDEGPAQMVATPRSKPEEHGTETSWTIRLDPGGAAEMQATEIHRGDQAFQLRTGMREKDARAQWVEQNLIAGWLPQVQVAPEVEFTELPQGEVKVGYQARSQALGRAEGGDLVVTLAPSSTLTSQLAPLPKRTLPVVMPPYLAPSRNATVVTLRAPEGMRVGPLPAGGEAAGGEFGSAKLEIEARDDGKAVQIKRSVVFDQDVISVDRYEAWRAWLSRVDSLLHRSVRFIPAR